MKNKTLTVYLALFFGAFGLHRLYLKGWRDMGLWLHLLASSTGSIGLRRAFALGQDDRLSWALVPVLGFSLFAACLSAIIYGLTSEERWNKAFGGSAGTTSGITIFGVILALLLGATALMSAIAFAGQRYFEYAIKAA